MGVENDANAKKQKGNEEEEREKKKGERGKNA